MKRLVAILALCIGLVLSACSGAGDDTDCLGGKCDGPGGDCDDPQYGDGTCQTQLGCAAPDIDCFRIFDDDAAARTWFTEFEATWAMSEGRPPRAVLPESDPRVARARDLLDRGWAAFREHRPVARLYDARPALVVVEDPAINAFVIGEETTDLSVFTVMVQTGLLDAGGSEDAMLGIMMHELQHAVGLHLIGDVRERIKRYYVAPAGAEPIGREELDDPAVRDVVTAWRTNAAQVGPYAQAELGGFSIAGTLDRVLEALVVAGQQSNPSGCASAAALINQLRADLAMLDPVSGALITDLAPVPARVDAALGALRYECLPAFPYSLVEVFASAFGTTPEMVVADLSPEDLALIQGRHAVDAFAAFVADRRAKMRTAESAFTGATGEPWSGARFFSFEEDADDISVPVMRASNLDPTGAAEFLAIAVEQPARAACDAELAAARVPSYGVDLVDEHHGTCWRRYHIGALAARDEATSPRERARLQPVGAVPAVRAPFARPRRFEDQVSHPQHR